MPRARRRIPVQRAGCVDRAVRGVAGTRNLVILGERVAIRHEQVPLDEAVDVPTAMAAQDGRCPEGLWRLVHYRDARTPHPALAAWRTGNEFEFTEPEVTAATLASA